MDPAYLIIAGIIVVLPFVLTKLLSGRSRDATRVLGAYEPAVKPATRAAANDDSIKSDSIEGQVKALLNEGRKIDAIKLMRETKDLSLEAAKDSVEAIEQHGRPTLGEMGMMSTIRLAQELSREVREKVAKGDKIEAVRLVRERTGLGLREAKEIVDRLG